MRVLAAIVMLIAAPASAQSLWVSGNDLLKRCTEPETDGWVYCAGYIDGVFSWIIYSQDLSDEIYVCVPSADITRTQLVDIVVKHLESEPESRHWDASIHVYNAFVAAFPCS